MNSLEQSAQIRRQVANVAYNILEEAPNPTEGFDGDRFYEDDNWNIEKDELFEATVFKLIDQGWHVEEGSFIDQQIQTRCELFLQSSDYEGMQEMFKREHESKKQDSFFKHGVSRTSMLNV